MATLRVLEGGVRDCPQGLPKGITGWLEDCTPLQEWGDLWFTAAAEH